MNIHRSMVNFLDSSTLRAKDLHLLQTLYFIVIGFGFSLDFLFGTPQADLSNVSYYKTYLSNLYFKLGRKL